MTKPPPQQPPLVLDDVDLRSAALRDLTLTVATGEALVVFGPDGSGKSSLIRLCAGLVAPDAGRVLLFGCDVAALARPALAALHRRTGVVFENGALVGQLSVAENVALPLAYRGELSREDRADRVRRCLDEVGMMDLAEREPARLSPAERRRAALARALVFDPELLMLDDPTKGLDSHAAAEMVGLLVRLRERTRATILVASGDVRGLKVLASRVAVLRGGVLTGPGLSSELRDSREDRWLESALGPAPPKQRR